MRKVKTKDVKLKAKVSYFESCHTDSFNKDKNGNLVEDWKFFITKQDKSVWMTLVRYDKNGNNVTQIDFDNISKKKLGKYIKSLQKIYKEM